jgi:hypothetical protein
VLDAEVGVVVDVAVERGHHVRARVGGRRRFELLAVERVRVGFGDDADARPAGVTEHGERAVGPPARRSSASAAIAVRSARVLSPSSPISAAAL